MESNGLAQTQAPGAKLAVARERAGLTVFQVAERLHLDVESVRALETDRLAIFGAAVFARGHLRRYAELLGIAASDIDAAYAAHTRVLPPMPDLLRGAPTPAAAGSATALNSGPLVIVAAVLVLAALAWWAVRTPPRSSPVGERTRVTVPAPSGTAAVVTRAPQGLASSAIKPAAPAPPATASSTSATPAAATGVAMQLSLTFSQDCWTEIYDARGGRLLYELAKAGSHRHLSGLLPVRILLGNPAAVTLELGGRAVPLPSDSHGTPLRFALDGRGRMLDVQAAAAPQGPAASAINPASAAAAPLPGSPAPVPSASEAH